MLNDTVIIKKVDKIWTAFNQDKRIGGSACQPCIVNIIRNLTKNSDKYKSIVVVKDNGEVIQEFQTGVRNA